jgi:FkbM family methyltransferase
MAGSTTTAPVPLLLRLLRQREFPPKLGLCERLFSAGLARNGVCWIETSLGFPWKLDMRNSTHRWIVYGKYEGGGFLNFAKKFLRPDSVIVDSGANIGQMLLYLARLAPKGSILAFEPGAEQRAWLKECLLRQPDFPVEVIAKGLGEQSYSARLGASQEATDHGSRSSISEAPDVGEPIEVVRLDEELKSRGVERVRLWKLDVEGYEPQAIAGAGDFVKQRRIDAIYAELFDEAGRTTHRLLGEAGYALHDIDDSGRPIPMKEYHGDHRNGLFLPK